ncbi:MAG: disulfide bond formation protein B [Actinomycetia bacterium]|nr:disulfide bond formation protein B [Actinomycetes bacterium]
MPHETATLFFALLAVVLAMGLIGLWSGLVLGRVQGRPLVAPVKGVAVELATAVAVTCTLGSLYLSEVANFRPCRLCWIQRGFMYPAAVLLIVALVTRRKALVGVAGALAVFGLPVSLFHRWEQAAGEVAGFCDSTNPCSVRWVNHFGFITIPTMAAIGFAGVFSLVALHLFWRNS